MMFLDTVASVVMQMTVMQVIHVAIVQDRRVATPFAVSMGMIVMH
jgi:hypothetical protein